MLLAVFSRCVISWECDEEKLIGIFDDAKKAEDAAMEHMKKAHGPDGDYRWNKKYELQMFLGHKPIDDYWVEIQEIELNQIRNKV